MAQQKSIAFWALELEFIDIAIWPWKKKIKFVGLGVNWLQPLSIYLPVAIELFSIDRWTTVAFMYLFIYLYITAIWLWAFLFILNLKSSKFHSMHIKMSTLHLKFGGRFVFSGFWFVFMETYFGGSIYINGYRPDFVAVDWTYKLIFSSLAISHRH